MSLDAVNILGINITKISKKEILEFCEKCLKTASNNEEKRAKNGPKIVTIVTPNPEQVVYAQHDVHFAEILNRADVAIPDGTGVVWASGLLGSIRLPQVIAGVDLMEDLIGLVGKWGVPVGLIGGRKGLAVEAFNCLQKKHPNLVGWGGDVPVVEIRDSRLEIRDQNEKEYFEQLAKRIVDTRLGIVFVGLGAPKQEYFIERLALSLRGASETSDVAISKKKIAAPSERTRDDKKIVLMSVGGSFDEISGRIPRAPTWVSEWGIKWLWRLTIEPWRIKRQLALVKFVWLVFLAKLSGRAT